LAREPFERGTEDPGGQGWNSPCTIRRVALFTLGCKINQYDSNSIIEDLKAGGHTIVSRMSDADVILVNTCTVTGRTDYKGRQLLRRAVYQNPDAVVIAVGCYAQVQPDAIAEIPGVDYVLGNAEKLQVAQWISTCTKQAAPVVRTGKLVDVSSLDTGSLPVHSGTTRAFLKIQDGCNHACSYCIIPRARGRSRSLPEARMQGKVRALAEKGFQEVILCGIHLGLYGHDLKPRTSLLEILSRLESEAGLPRIRISSIEPNEFTLDLIELFSQARHLCPHFHLPLQSGDAGILKAMNRPYGPTDFFRKVEEIHARMPEAAIGVDVIAGFPGESETAFQNTVSMLEALPLSYFHVFPYSNRPGTPASGFPDPVSPQTIRERADVLRKMGREKRLRFHERFLGRSLEILVETRRDQETGMLKGVTRNYITILFEGNDDLQKKLVRVRVRWVDEKQGMGEGEEPVTGKLLK
jgi:threonylcarbamoyladenosine tRNA methylthiotransferase MtaB